MSSGTTESVPEFASVADRLAALREVVRRYDYEYFVLNAPSVSDSTYDGVFGELQKLEQEHPEFATADSPTLRVGSDLDASFPEVEHSIPVLSLDKAYSEAEVLAWVDRVRREADVAPSIVAEEKLDGVSVVLYYERGTLARAVSRGNGRVGNDITANVRTIRGLPLKLDRAVDVAVRGEVFIEKDAFNRINSELETPYANARNLTGGVLRRAKSRQSADVPLSIYVYEGFFNDDSPLTHVAVLARLAELHLPTNPRTTLFSDSGGAGSSLSDVGAFIERATSERQLLPYDIDGLVFKVDDLNIRERLGYTGHHPRWAVAYKFDSPTGVTTLKEIDLQIGRTGRATPVARVEPVAIGGTIVSNATLHNQAYISALELAPGDRVTLSRRGDVIPAVESVVEKGEGRTWQMPKDCPSCGTTLKLEGAHHFCGNFECPARVRGRLIFFVSRPAMDIDGLGPETIDLLLDRGLVRRPSDLYRLDESGLLELERFGPKRVENLLKAIEASRRRPLPRFLVALGLRDLGPTVAERLVAAGFDTVDRLLDVAERGDAQLLSGTEGVGELTAQRIVDELSREAVRAEIAALLDAGVDPSAAPHEAERSAEAESLANTLSGVFRDQVWCVTGTFEAFKPRSAAMAYVEAGGGRVVESVSKTTTHLLAGTAAGGKLAKAKKLGIAVIDEAGFLSILRGAGIEVS